MNRTIVSKIVAAVPERALRVRSGTPFSPSTAVSANGSQVAHLAKFLNWLTPLNAINEEDQRALGCMPSHGRLSRHDDEDEIDDELPRV